MECLSSFELISLLDLMMEHIHKVVHGKNERHDMPYGYWLNRVFDYFRIVCEIGTLGTGLQQFFLKTLIITSYVKKKLGTISLEELRK